MAENGGGPGVRLEGRQTIEAGLVIQKLLLRHRARAVFVVRLQAARLRYWSFSRIILTLRHCPTDCDSRPSANRQRRMPWSPVDRSRPAAKGYRCGPSFDASLRDSQPRRSASLDGAASPIRGKLSFTPTGRSGRSRHLPSAARAG